MIFLSTGSNYNLKQAWRHLTVWGGRRDSDDLQTTLTERYKGRKTLLYARGRGALAAAIRLATGGKGNVAVTSLTCYAVVEAIETAGCQPVFIDVNPLTLHFDARKLADTMKHKEISAVIVQNTLGIPVDIDAIMKVTRHFNVPVIEDLAHAVGGRYANGQEIGTVGDFTMLSFGRDKMLDTINGGALVIRTDKIKATVVPPLGSVGVLGQLRDRIYPIIGVAARNLWRAGLGRYILAAAYKLKLAVRSADGGTMRDVRLPYWQAKLALQQLEQIDQMAKDRLAIHNQYRQELASFCTNPSSNAIRFPILVNNRQHVTKCLRDEGIFVEDPWYDVPVIPERLYDKSGFSEDECPVATDIANHLMNLPTHQAVREGDVAKIISIMKNEAQPWK